MKEVLTKKFWRDVKKIFDEARAEEPPPENVKSSGEPKPTSASDAPKQPDAGRSD